MGRVEGGNGGTLALYASQWAHVRGQTLAVVSSIRECGEIFAHSVLKSCCGYPW